MHHLLTYHVLAVNLSKHRNALWRSLKIFEDLWRSLKTDAGPAQVEESSIKAPLSCSPYLTCAAPLVAEPCWTNTSIALDHWTIVHLDRQPAGVQHWKTTVNWWLGSVLLESLQYPQNISNYMVVQITHPQNSHVAGFFLFSKPLAPNHLGNQAKIWCWNDPCQCGNSPCSEVEGLDNCTSAGPHRLPSGYLT